MQLAPIGVPGELLLSGPRMAKGEAASLGVPRPNGAGAGA